MGHSRRKGPPDGTSDGGNERSRCYQYVQRVAKSLLRRSDLMVPREACVYADWDAFDLAIQAAGGQWERVMGGNLIVNLPRASTFDLDRAMDQLNASAATAEQELMAAMKRDVAFLAEDVGERHLGRPAALRRAADWLAEALAMTGMVVSRQTFEVDGREAENLEAVLTGTSRPDEFVVVGAHYDTVRGTPGADEDEADEPGDDEGDDSEA